MTSGLARTHASGHVQPHAQGWLARDAEELIDRQSRLMELARHNGYEIDVQPWNGLRLWVVPEPYLGIVGLHVAVVR